MSTNADIADINADLGEYFDDFQQLNTEELLYVEVPQHTLSDLEEIFNKEEKPAHWSLFPDLSRVDTEYDFDIHIDQGEKINWMYSSKLDKVYIKLNSTMNLTVSYEPLTCSGPLFVRAMIVFSRRDEMHLPVARCPNHRMRSSVSATDAPDFHILKCCNLDTVYHGIEKESTFGQRASLVVPMSAQPQLNDMGRVQQSLGLEFLCQNSCSNGIQRKQTVLVFTLENERHEILGKRVMNFKVCSCPKRDMGKEVNTTAPQRKRAATQPAQPIVPSGKHPSKMICLQPAQTAQSAVVVKHEPAVVTSSPDGASPVSVDAQSPNERAVGQLSAGIDSFKFETGASPDTLPMSSPQPPQPPPPADSMMMMAAGGGFPLNITLPTRDSAQHVLRCAYNEVTGNMARDKENSMKFIPYVRQLEQYAHDNNLRL